MTNTVVETPIYDGLLGEMALPPLPLWLGDVCWNWELFGELSKVLGPREIDRTPKVRLVRVDPHADRIEDVITYQEWYGAWLAYAL
jgi:hypothetical protein